MYAVEVEEKRGANYVHHVTYLAMLAIVTTLIADQVFRMSERKPRVEGTLAPFLSFTYAVTYWTAFFSIITSVVSGLISVLSHRNPAILTPTILFFVTMFFWVVHKIAVETVVTLKLQASDPSPDVERNEYLAYIIPTSVILFCCPLMIFPMLRDVPRYTLRICNLRVSWVPRCADQNASVEPRH